jgi:hypothetical protein
MVCSNTRGWPLGVGGRRGMAWMALRASSEALAEVDHSSSAWARVPSGLMVMRKRTCPWSGPSTAVPIWLRTCWPQALR